MLDGLALFLWFNPLTLGLFHNTELQVELGERNLILGFTVRLDSSDRVEICR